MVRARRVENERTKYPTDPEELILNEPSRAHLSIRAACSEVMESQ